MKSSSHSACPEFEDNENEPDLAAGSAGSFQIFHPPPEC